MGMFDEVIVYCPHCENEQLLQSKMGPCHLIRYTLDNATAGILEDLATEGYTCEKCDKPFWIHAEIVKVAETVAYNPLKEDAL